MNESPRTRVLFLTTSLATHGPARALVSIARRLERTRFEVAFCECGPRHGDNEAARGLADAGIAHYALGAGGILDVRAVVRLVRLLKALRIDVLHTRLVRADFYGRLAGRLAGVPLIITNLCDVYSEHFRSWHGPIAGRMLQAIDRATLPLAHVIVANSDGVRSDIIERVGVDPAHVTRIYNGVDVSRFRLDAELRGRVRTALGLRPDAWVVGSVGRLAPKKNFRTLVAAADILRLQAPELRVLIVGEGPERAALERQIHGLRLEGTVTLLGERQDVAGLLAAMDVFAFSSLFEGNPNAVLEAMSTGLPVVVADAPGSREVVVDGSTGRLVPSEDPQAMAAALLEFRDPSARRSMGAAARAFVADRFNPDRGARAFESLYETARRPPATP